jgi:hypothetical protein
MLSGGRPGLLNSVIGLITALINIYTAQNGLWSVTAIVTVVLTGTSAAIMGVFSLVFTLLWRRMKNEKREQ